jgi:deazaflavin-dependent oxidoreductase (nitroreductase family)
VVFASKAGAPTNPAWYYNLKANPDTMVEVGTEEIAVHAEEASGEERDRLFRTQAERIPAFAEYERTAGGRTIPVMVLVPSGA